MVDLNVRVSLAVDNDDDQAEPEQLHTSDVDEGERIRLTNAGEALVAVKQNEQAYYRAAAVERATLAVVRAAVEWAPLWTPCSERCDCHLCLLHEMTNSLVAQIVHTRPRRAS